MEADSESNDVITGNFGVVEAAAAVALFQLTQATLLFSLIETRCDFDLKSKNVSPSNSPAFITQQR